MAQTIEVGDVYLCAPSGDLPPVEVSIARIETMGDVITGDALEPELAAIEVIHVQMISPGDQDYLEVAHSPFALGVIQECSGELLGKKAASEMDYEGGYEMWKRAVNEDGAGYFTINPADAYWAMLGVVQENKE